VAPHTSDVFSDASTVIQERCLRSDPRKQ